MTPTGARSGREPRAGRRGRLRPAAGRPVNRAGPAHPGEARRHHALADRHERHPTGDPRHGPV